MQVQNIVATDAKSAFKIATDLLGEDAVIMETKDHPEGIEVLAGVSSASEGVQTAENGQKKTFFANPDVFGNVQRVSVKGIQSRHSDSGNVGKPSNITKNPDRNSPKMALPQAAQIDQKSQLDVVCGEVRELRRLVDRYFLETKLSGDTSNSEIVKVLKTKGFHESIIGFIDDEISESESKESAWLALAKYFRDKLRVDQERLDDSRTLCVAGDPGSRRL